MMDFSDELYDRFRTQVVIKVWGDSAEEDMRHGDWVLVTKDPNFRLTGRYVVIANEEHEFLVKILRNTENGLEFHSNNPEYPPISLKPGFEMIGFAIGWKRDKGAGKYLEVGDRDGLKPGFRD